MVGFTVGESVDLAIDPLDSLYYLITTSAYHLPFHPLTKPRRALSPLLLG